MSDWKRVKLEEIAEITGGGTPSKSNDEYWNGDIPWLTPTDVTKSKKNFLSDTESYITDIGLKKSSAKLIPENNVLMTSRATIGKSIINKVPMATNQGFANFICDGMKVSSEYLLYLLNSKAKKFEQLGSGSTFKEISKGELKSFVVDLPPVVEQQKIAAILSSVDEAIEKTEQIIEQTEKVKKGLMQQLLTKGIGHTEFKYTPFGKIPIPWKVTPVEQFATVEYGVSEAVSNNTDSSIGIPILTGANITLDGKIDLFKQVYIQKRDAEKFQLKKGDLLFNWRSGSQHHVGKTAIFNLDGDFTYASFILRIRVNGECDYRYYYYLLNYLKSIGYFSKDTSVQVNFKLNATSFRELLLIKPSLDEQKQISQRLLAIDNKIKLEKDKLLRLANLKHGLMQQLLTGKVRVPIDDEEEVKET
ncbi:restriction endonuclease subunit S [Lentibacillus cibarius]|uniref:restriction endonuclease subunit S n=1 Tax=Lentibacillus cibarius TaxID=2583219 RepID=UPI00163D9706|nr:restriction endonuclease subunit S [Lentibacillus cibarius]